MTPPSAKRRGSSLAPPNRFERQHHEADLEQLDHELVAAADEGDPARPGDPRVVPTEFIPDRSKSVISENTSPDIPFRWSVNPYRGCEHGCAYCYARPYHEFLGMNAGLDFETKIMVKFDAPALLRDELCDPKWRPELISMSGVTDCYQPAERRFRLTRGCLEVMLEARQPVGIITKNALVLRDLDLLRELAARRLVRVALSITTLDRELARTMEPRTSLPCERLRAIRKLAAAGVPTQVMVAPIIPGLTDSEVPEILRAAADAGAKSAGYTMLRLPLAVEPIFLDWLDRNYPAKRERLESLIRATRGGRLNDSNFATRMRGQGLLAEQIASMFGLFKKKFGLDGDLPPLDFSQFRPPRASDGQLQFF